MEQENDSYFYAVCEWLESEVEGYSLPGIHQKMVALSGAEENVFCQKLLKPKFQKRYGDHIRFMESEGKANMVCFQNVADYLITDKWYLDREVQFQDEAEPIITMAGKLVHEGIRAGIYDCESYPCKTEIESNKAAKK